MARNDAGGLTLAPYLRENLLALRSNLTKNESRSTSGNLSRLNDHASLRQGALTDIGPGLGERAGAGERAGEGLSGGTARSTSLVVSTTAEKDFDGTYGRDVVAASDFAESVSDGLACGRVTGQANELLTR